MKTISERILAKTQGLPEGQTIYAKSLLHLGARAGVDQALSRLVRRGRLMRVGRGLYVRPIESRFGVRPPAVEKVVASIAEARGETIAVHGAVAANHLGLTTQVPMRTVYLTSGPSRSIGLGRQNIELRHAPKWQFAAPGEAGTIIRALAWMGRERAGEALRTLKRRIPAQKMASVSRHGPRLPTWLAHEVRAA